MNVGYRCPIHGPSAVPPSRVRLGISADGDQAWAAISCPRCGELHCVPADLAAVATLVSGGVKWTQETEQTETPPAPPHAAPKLTEQDVEVFVLETDQVDILAAVAYAEEDG